MTGLATVPKGVKVRPPRTDDIPTCQVGGCNEQPTLVVVAEMQSGDWKTRVCRRHGQELLLELGSALNGGAQ